MSPGRTEEPGVSWDTKTDNPPTTYEGFPRNVKWIDEISFDANLQPKKYDILGTHPESRILFLDVNILDSTGNEPFQGDVLIEGELKT